MLSLAPAISSVASPLLTMQPHAPPPPPAGGERFMPRYDERLELAPRDIVARSIQAEMMVSWAC